MKPTIVLATDSREPSGVGEHMLTLGAALRDQFDVVFAMPSANDASLFRRAAQAGLQVKGFDADRPGELRRWLTQEECGLVHVHAGIGWEGHALCRAAKAASLPVVRTEHLPYLLTSVMQQAEYRAMLLSVDCRIAVSEAVAQSHRGHGGGMISIVKNGVEARGARQPRNVTRAALELAEADTLILTVGRFAPQKGHDTLLEATPDILREHARARFALVGSGAEQSRIASSIAERRLAANFLMLGTRDDVSDLLAAADLFVLPSQFEGLSLALLEAMASGVPVVATGVAGSLEALGEAHPFLVPAGDPQALSEAVIRALDDRGTAQAAAASARERFSALFTAERMAAQTATIYRDLLSRQTVRSRQK